MILSGGRARAAAAALGLASLAPPAVVLHDIARNGRNVPYVDQWRDVELSVKAVTGTVTAADVFEQVSAHFIVSHHLTTVALARLTHWDIKAGMYLSVALAAGVFVLAAGLFGPGRYLLWLPLSALVFSPRQREVWLWSYLEFYPFVSAVFLGAVFLLWRWPGSRRALAGAATLAAIATFSVASGLAVWPVLFLALPALGFRSRTDRLLWLAAMLVVLAGYFVRYHWLRAGVVTGPAFLGGFVLAYLGSPFVPFEAGALGTARSIAAAGLALTAANGVFLWRTGRDAERRLLAAGLAVIAFAVACAVLTAAGRGGSHGMTQALASRYVAHGSLFWLAAVGLAGVALSAASEGVPATPARRRLAALDAAALVLVVARLAVLAQGALAAPPLVTEAQEACVRAYPVSRDAGCLRGLHPRPWRIAPRIDALFEHRLALFADVPVPATNMSPEP